MHMVTHQMIFVDPTLPVPRKLIENVAQMRSQTSIDHFLPILRNENHMVFAVRPRMRQNFDTLSYRFGFGLLVSSHDV
jgi:hypothetical protein